MSIDASNSDNSFKPITTKTIMLSPTSTQWAADICQTVTDLDDQWQSFMRALAIAGFEQWLNESSTPLIMTYPRTAAPQTDTHVQVGDFRLCILPMGTLQDEQVRIPAAAVTSRDKAHLYVLVEVHEEIDQVHVGPGLRHDQLSNLLPQHADGESYVVPVEQFTVRPEKLLWYLSCLEPEAIIPAVETAPVPSPIKAIINTGIWLQGQLDTVAEQLAWQFIPSLTPSYGLRGSEMRDSEKPTEKLVPILETLKRQGVEIPTEAVGACKSISVGETVCQVYTLLWELPETHEWSLFVLVGPAGDQPLPVGMELQVSEQAVVMSRSELRHDSVTTFLYIQVIGNLDEQFTVEIGAPDGETLTLPAFGFESVV
ncbi:DUF1822 family protein [Leptolyngbya cf. ectocarpi LEGE 11479]|uniref:DUF1822 family protein n=1 Tax=Leptolyngbya cf. ectocarpi LEGE 11479 TaxID=1828722 RepID=A0A929F7U3_LEPEC|nr:DUF1822 family protein [Leptolyngbya ectocarpi]MBE9068915.1 DUF1822 family protein [Leptolyngbya cf. ectocarpi LEGE 11479]